MDNPLLEYFFLWLPPITKENTSDIFLDISDIFYIEFQVNIWGGINCNYTNYRGEQFYNSIYSNQNNDTVFINKRLEYAYQTKQNNYYKHEMCISFSEDLESAYIQRTPSRKTNTRIHIYRLFFLIIVLCRYKK